MPIGVADFEYQPRLVPTIHKVGEQHGMNFGRFQVINDSHKNQPRQASHQTHVDHFGFASKKNPWKNPHFQHISTNKNCLFQLPTLKHRRHHFKHPGDPVYPQLLVEQPSRLATSCTDPGITFFVWQPCL